MTKVQVFSLSLAAVLVGSVHAQSCSGGAGGGIDATGNECNTPDDVATYFEHPSFRGQNAPSIRWEKMSAQSSKPTVLGVARKIVKPAAPASAPAKTAKGQHWSEAPCSGGAFGGMDVNGNQCGEAPSPVGSATVARSKTP